MNESAVSSAPKQVTESVLNIVTESTIPMANESHTLFASG